MTKRYWLKGGLIGFIGIGIVSFVLALFGFVLARNPFWIFAESVSAPFYSCNGVCISEGLIFTIPVFIIETFIIGVIIGWLYGKIKNRNKVIQ